MSNAMFAVLSETQRSYDLSILTLLQTSVLMLTVLFRSQNDQRR